MVAPLCRNLLNMERSHKPYGVSHDSWNWSGVNEINTALERREVQEKKEKNKDKDKNKNKNKTKGRKKKKKRSSLRPCPRRATNLVTEVGVHSRSIQGKRFPLAVLVLKGEEMKSLD